MDASFWKGKKVLITGHTGFKGGWLSLWLQRLGAKVYGYALPPPSRPSLFEAANVGRGMISIVGDVRDLSHLTKVVVRCEPEVLIHMAAQSLVRCSYENPVETYATNVMGTAHVLETARHAKSVKVLINVTSDKCYENRGEKRRFEESDPMGGDDPYSSSKGCAELVTAGYRRSFFTPRKNVPPPAAVATVRAGNVIGGGDWAKDRLIPDIVRALMRGEAVVLRNPRATRPWQHVLEPLSGYLRLAQKLWENGQTFTGAWNFGPSERGIKTVSWVAAQLARTWGDGARWKLDRRVHPREAQFLQLDSSKARRKLGWKQKLNLKKALSWTADWYKHYERDHDMRRFTLRQISRFMAEDGP